ncbi:MAG: hypothetical protein FWE48_05925 [Coriobacteriia bacterium]|nr:hypothetical protein [Coriobacteriia bacterium]MCL2746605.1 hypothetical protein [Coriobacteriia bacterium]MCL2870609.1 hypothetical protein [Coriobacteriia bacterium]
MNDKQLIFTDVTAKVKGRNATRISALVLVGSLLLQSFLAILSEMTFMSMLPMHYTLNGSPAVSYPPQMLMMIVLGIVSVIAFLCLCVNLYDLLRQDKRRFVLIGAGCFGLISIAIPLKVFPFMDPVNGTNVTLALMAVSFIATVLFRLLLAVALPRPAALVKRLLVGASALFFAAAILPLIYYVERSQTWFGDVVLYERVLMELSLPLEWLLSLPVEVHPALSLPSWTNTYLLFDTLLFGAILIFACWNLPRFLPISSNVKSICNQSNIATGNGVQGNKYEIFSEGNPWRQFKKTLSFDVKKLRYRQQSYKGKFATNVLRSLALCGAAVLLWPALILVPLLPLVVLGAYVYLSYKYMIPLPKGNLLSVSAPAVIFTVAAFMMTVTDTFFFIHNPLSLVLYSALNYSAYWVVQLISVPIIVLLFGTGDFIVSWFYWAAFISALIPTLLIYWGLRLKIRKQKKLNMKRGV